MNWRFLLVPAAVAASLATLPATASAGTNIGATCDTPGYVNFPVFQFLVGAGSPSYTVPAGGGILTRWAVARETGATPNQTKLKLFKPTGVPNQFTTVAEDAQTAGAGESQFGTRIAVAGGEVLGIYGTGTNMTPYCPFTGSAIASLNPAGDPAVGSTVTKAGSGVNAVVDIAAYIEPDADGDGFGDESQDACPTNASTQGSCPVADTSGPAIDTKAVKLSKLLKKSKIEMTVGSNEAATVTIDGTLSVPGGSSKTYKLKPVSGSVPAGGKIKLKLKVPKKALKALRKKGKATSIINLVAKDAAGNQSTGKFTSKLKIVKTRRLIHR